MMADKAFSKSMDSGVGRTLGAGKATPQPE